MAISGNTLTTGKDLPLPQTPFVDPKTGVLSNDGYQYFLSLINKLATSIPTTTIATGLSAQGTTQATALLLSAGWNEVDTASVADNGVLLDSLQPGRAQTVFNESGIAINVYPAPGLQINALAMNAPFALGNNTRVTFDFTSATQIRS